MDSALERPSTNHKRQNQTFIHVWRGILIALIVLGHNRLFASDFLRSYHVLYNFHVEAFLIIPFLRPLNPARKMLFWHPLTTYYRPFVIFVTLYAIIFALSGAPDAPATATGVATSLARGIVIANSVTLNEATGFEMFWFLPVFVILSTVRPIVERVHRGWFVAVLALATVAHVTIGYLPTSAVENLPWGLPIVGYILLPCLLASAAGSYDRKILPVYITGAIFVMTCLACFYYDFWINLSDFKVYTLSDIPRLVVTDLSMISASIFLYQIGDHIKSTALDALGRYSLPIYLIHGIIGYSLVKLTGHGHSWIVKLGMLAITYPVTLGLSFLAARALLESRAGTWIFGTK